MTRNKVGYQPVDDDSDSGYKRPPKEPTAVCDYFSELFFLEDGGKFATEEMDALLTDPQAFFTPKKE